MSQPQSARPWTGRTSLRRQVERRRFSGRRQWHADGLLLLAALIWGSTFVLVKQTVAQFPVYAFLFLRFALATVALLLFFRRRLRALGFRELRVGATIGVFLFGGYALQTVGLQYTTASKAGFITGLYVVMVPILSALLLGRAADPGALLGLSSRPLGWPC